MTEAKKAGFWTSVPGILTGLAAVITAVAGLVVAISQRGPPSPSEKEGSEGPSAARHEPENEAVAGSVPADAGTFSVPEVTWAPEGWEDYVDSPIIDREAH